MTRGLERDDMSDGNCTVQYSMAVIPRTTPPEENRLQRSSLGFPSTEIGDHVKVKGWHRCLPTGLSAGQPTRK